LPVPYVPRPSALGESLFTLFCTDLCGEDRALIAQATLTKIHRQRIPELRAAIEDLSNGSGGEGFGKLDRFGAIQEIADDADRLAAVAEKQIEA
jgi:hypothetical protein